MHAAQPQHGSPGSRAWSIDSGAGGAPDAMRPAAAILDPDIYVPALLTVLSGTLTHNASIFYRKNFGIGISDWRIMYRLAAEPWITANQVCLASVLDKAVVSRSIAWMERRGLVHVRDDASDGRRRLIALSPTGHDLYNRVTVVALERERNFLAVLTEEEVATTISLLTKLRRNLSAFSKPVAIPPPGIPSGAPVPKTAIRRRPPKPRA